MGKALGDAIAMLAYLAVFGVISVAVMVIGAITTIWLPMPIWVVAGVSVMVGAVASSIIVGSWK